MIDLHVHMLPGVDDGPEDLEESLKMAQGHAQAGFRRVVATPHWVEGSTWAPPPAVVWKRVRALRQALADQEIDLEVGPGMEIALTLKIPALLKSGRVLSLNDGPYVLVELPFQRLPAGWDQILFEISAQGYRVLLAHPERCGQLASEPDIQEALREMGVGIQVNWKSLLGRYGHTIQETAWTLLEGGLAHCLATDGHRYGDVSAAHLSRAKRALTERVGENRAKVLIKENPGRVWAGGPLETITPVKARRKKGWRRWFT